MPTRNLDQIGTAWITLIIGGAAAIFAGCDGGEALVVALDVEAVVSDVVSTTVTVDITCDPAAAVLAELDGFEVWRSGTADVAHHLVLGGLIPDSDYILELSASIADAPATVESLSLTTGSVPADLPAVTLTIDGDPAPDPLMATAFLAEPGVAAVLDDRGRYRWWYSDDRANLAQTRALPSHDGRSLLVNAFAVFGGGTGDGTAGEVLRVALDGTVTETLTIPGSHHDFVELDDGTIATLVFDPREIEGHEVLGDALVEVAPDGTQTSIWSVWDDFEYDGDLPPDPAEWSHANALDYLPDDDSYLVSLRDLDTLVLIDRSTRTARWLLGGDHGQFTIDGQPFEDQHQFLLHGADDGSTGADELIVFDNGAVDALDSRLVCFTLDPDADPATARESWSIHRDPPAYSFALGDVIAAPDDHLLVSWGALGTLELLAPPDPDSPTPDTTADPTWRLDAEIGAGLGYLSTLDPLQMIWGCSGEGCAAGE